jgi:hypothetical protein
LALFAAADVYPPEFDIGLTVDPQAGTHKIRIQGDDDYQFGSPLFNDPLAISDAEAADTSAGAQGKKIDTNLAAISSPAVTFFRARLEWQVSGVTHYTNWSNTQGHGDVTVPSVTSSTTQTSAENAPVLQTIAFSEVCGSCALAATGDGPSIEFVGGFPGSSIQYRLAGNASPDFEAKGSYVFTVTPTDLSSNVGSPTTITLNINDVDELANSFTLTDVTNAAKDTDFTGAAITVAGLATGYAAPIAVSGDASAKYSKNGAALTAAAGTVVNGDTVAPFVHSSTLDATTKSCIITIGDVPANQVSDSFDVTTVNTLAPPTGSALWVEAKDLTTLFQSNAGSTAVAADGDVVGYWGDKSGNAKHLKSVADNTTRPVYKVVSGKQLIRFDGVDDLLRVLDNLGTYAAGGATFGLAIKAVPGTAKALVSFGRTTDTNSIYNPVMTTSGSSTQAGARIQNSSGTTVLSNGLNMGTGTFGGGSAFTLIVQDTGSAFNVYVNNVLTAQSPVAYTRAGSLILDIMALGGYARGTPTGWFSADVYALTVHNSVLNSTDRGTLHTYLASLI